MRRPRACGAFSIFLTALWLVAGGATALVAGTAAAPDAGPASPVAGSPPGDLYVTATAHLDTQWRWTVRETIAEHLPATLRENFALFERDPDYVFSFEGAFRYQLIREYYPEQFERLRDYVRRGRWRVCGSWLDAVDTNIPAPESLIRHALLGNGWFRRELGVESRDVFLPDCFGFGFALPAVAAHCGLESFSTQKLSWGSSVGVPFDLGLWEGVDGSTLVAALRPDDYVSRIEGDLSADSTWVARIRHQGETSGVWAGLKYFGTGDEGGGPDSASVAWLERSLPGRGEGPLRVVPAAPDRLARDLTPRQEAGLPRYRGELLMTSHGVGCYTSQAAMKRWNRRNEILADAAERAAVLAHWLGALPYPRRELREAWTRFLWHQFHDDLTGTSIPEAYRISWDDELIAQNQFARILTAAVGGVARGLDTRAEGATLVVFNPLSWEREDLVEAEVELGDEAPDHVRVFGPDGAEVPSQVTDRPGGGRLAVAFTARVPAVGVAVFDVRPADRPCRLETGLGASAEVLENGRYRLTAREGEVVSIRDLARDRELLSAPLALQLLDDEPGKWAAWEIDHDDLLAPPRREVRLRVGEVESGPARVAWRLAATRADGSTFEGRIGLAAGAAGDRVEIDLDIDWRTPGTLLKAAFPLAVAADSATYDLGLGTIRRGVNRPELYEVPAQRWADVTDAAGGFGVAVLNDGRYGWDRPDRGTLRLSLVHTPAVVESWRWLEDQRSQDLGRHQVKLGLCGHGGDWRAGVADRADRLNQPLLAFQAPAHPGDLGRRFGWLTLAGPAPATSDPAASGPGRGAIVRALKLAEEGDEIVVRLQERRGRPLSRLRLQPAGGIRAAREVDGAERPLPGAAAAAAAPPASDGALTLDLAPYQLRTFALAVGGPDRTLPPPRGEPLDLPYDLDGISRDGEAGDGAFDADGHALAGELLPPLLVRDGLPLRTGPQAPGEANVLRCRGQELPLPAGGPDGIVLLAAAVGRGREAVFGLGDRDLARWVPDHARPVGQWDSRLVGDELRHDPALITPAYVDPTPVGWIGTHRHTAEGRNEPYALTHFFLLRLPVSEGARVLTLPDDPDVRLLAATAVWNPGGATRAAQPLLDRCRRAAVEVRAERRAFVDSVRVELFSPNPGARLAWAVGEEELREYAAPFVLRRSADLRVRAEAPGLPLPQEATVGFVRVEPWPGEPGPDGGGRPGLRCRYYEGAWERLPDFAGLVPAREGEVAEVGIPAWSRAENVGVVQSGYLRAPRRGTYRLTLWSDDGAALLVGDRIVAINDGLHGRTAVMAELPLADGLHRLEVRWFQHLGGRALELWWSGPGIEPQAVPAEALRH